MFLCMCPHVHQHTILQVCVWRGTYFDILISSEKERENKLLRNIYMKQLNVIELQHYGIVEICSAHMKGVRVILIGYEKCIILKYIVKSKRNLTSCVISNGIVNACDSSGESLKDSTLKAANENQMCE